MTIEIGGALAIVAGALFFIPTIRSAFMRSSPLFALLLATTAVPAAWAAAAESGAASAAAAISYPETRRVDLVEEQFGVKVADPYRWLENDVRNDAEVRAWVT